MRRNYLTDIYSSLKRGGALLVAGGCFASIISAQTVTVSSTLPADEITIQAAIDSLAPGGSRDDGNVSNNTVQVLDGEVYAEGVHIDGHGLVLEGTGIQRPRIIPTAAQSIGGYSLRIDTDNDVVLRNLIVLPDAASPPDRGIVVDEFTGTSGQPGYHITLEDVLVAPNDGSDQPLSTDGATPRPSGITAFGSSGIDFFSTPTGSTPEVTMIRTVVTAANASTDDMVRVYTDNGAVLIGEGCRFTYSNDVGFRFIDAVDTTAQWMGTALDPIILYGNEGAAIQSDNSFTRGVAEMQYVAITRNSLGGDIAAVVDLFAGAANNIWQNVIVAGNSSRETDTATDGPFSLATSLTISNSIIAGDSVMSPKQDTNLMRMNGTFSNVVAEGVCIDLSGGSTSLNETWQPANADLLDGIIDGNLFEAGAGVTNASPEFISLDLANSFYLAIANTDFATAGVGGAPLTGPGRLDEFPVSPIRKREGSLQSALQGVTVPSASSSNKYSQPTFDELMVFRSAIDRIIAGQYQAAANRLGLVNYDIIVQEDAGIDDFYVMLEERSSNRTWRGLFAVDLSPERQLVISSPHPLFDGTRLEGIDVFVDTDALTFAQSGTHRNNSPILSPCDGTFSGGVPYRLSDMAHNAESFFQVHHEQYHRRYDATLTVNVHGMADTSDTSDVTISNGTTTDVIGASLSKDIANRMNEILVSDPRFAHSHQEPGVSASLSGSTNTQGRYTNGSHAPCFLPASAIFPERFIHMEQDPDVRSGSSSNWAFVTQTYNDLVPLFPAIVPDPPEDGSLVADYQLDADAVSQTSSPAGSLGSGIGGATDRFGTSGGALSFSGSGPVTIPDFEYTGGDFEFTLAFWFNSPSINDSFHYLYSHGSIGADGEVTIPNSLHVYLASPGNEPRVRFTLGDGREWLFNSGVTTTPNEWHLFTLTYSQTTGAIVYIDGADVGSLASHANTRFDPEGDVILGGRTDLTAERFYGNSLGAPGLLDSARIWNAALTPSEITALLDPTLAVEGWSLY